MLALELTILCVGLFLWGLRQQAQTHNEKMYVIVVDIIYFFDLKYVSSSADVDGFCDDDLPHQCTSSTSFKTTTS